MHELCRKVENISLPHYAVLSCDASAKCRVRVTYGAYAMRRTKTDEIFGTDSSIEDVLSRRNGDNGSYLRLAISVSEALLNDNFTKPVAMSVHDTISKRYAKFILH